MWRCDMYQNLRGVIALPVVGELLPPCLISKELVILLVVRVNRRNTC